MAQPLDDYPSEHRRVPRAGATDNLGHRSDTWQSENHIRLSQLMLSGGHTVKRASHLVRLA
ncbi:MAG TPA: hypothetical protein VF598_11630 [Hymenobacter sp.]